MQGKQAVITGGGGGIGRAVGELFCKEGGAVLLVDRDEAALADAVEGIRERVSGAEIETFIGDIGDYDQVNRMLDLAVSRFGGLNVLVNNAAIRNVESIERSEFKAWDDLIAVNLMGAVNICKAAVGELRKAKKASVVNVSSVYGVMARKHWGIYDVTKAALISLTKTFAVEEAENGIRVNAICVASTLTPYTIERAKATRNVDEEDLLREDKDSNLMRRWAHPREIAYPILWLASDEASFVTGATLMVDAGRSII